MSRPDPARAAAESGGAPEPLSPKVRIIALIVASAFFMEQMDATVLATALPELARELGANPLHMNLALTSYLISLTALIPASGKLADRFGARRVFCIAIVVFTAGSVLCSLAGSLAFLVAARFVQGAGAALMSPVGRLLLLRAVPKSAMVRAMAWVLLPTMIAPIAGPPLGGFIVTYFSWEWIFYINVPIGLLGLAVAWKYIDADEPPPGRDAFDHGGLFLCATAVSGLIVGLELLSRDMIAAPFLDFSLMHVPTFNIATQAGVLFRIGIGAVPFLLPMMFQLGFGLSAFDSGMLTFASGISALIVKMTTVPILKWLGYRRVMVWNSLLCGVFLALCAFFRADWPMTAMYAVLLLGGFVRSLQFNAFGTIAFAEVPRERMSAAISLHSTVQQLSMTLGVSVSAAALGASVMLSGDEVAGVDDFSTAFLVVAAISSLSAPLCARLEPGAGDELSGRLPRQRTSQG